MSYTNKPPYNRNKGKQPKYKNLDVSFKKPKYKRERWEPETDEEARKNNSNIRDN